MKSVFDLQGRVIALTGAAGMLGTEFAKALAQYGASLALIDIDTILLHPIVEEIRAKFDIRAVILNVDITNEAEVAKASEYAQEKLGPIYGLINNAARNPVVTQTGLDSGSRLEDFARETWDLDISVGLTGAYLCAKHFGPKIREAKSNGVIVNISSDLGLIAPDQRLYANESEPAGSQAVKPVSYSVVKTGIIGLTRYLATYWPGEVRSNALCLGGVIADQDSTFVERVSKLIPLGRMADRKEHANSMVYMMSDAASYMNGSIIALDGGRSTW